MRAQNLPRKLSSDTLIDFLKGSLRVWSLRLIIAVYPKVAKLVMTPWKRPLKNWCNSLSMWKVRKALLLALYRLLNKYVYLKESFVFYNSFHKGRNQSYSRFLIVVIVYA